MTTAPEPAGDRPLPNASTPSPDFRRAAAFDGDDQVREATLTAEDMQRLVVEDQLVWLDLSDGTRMMAIGANHADVAGVDVEVLPISSRMFLMLGSGLTGSMITSTGARVRVTGPKDWDPTKY
jgi:hypothetical protein